MAHKPNFLKHTNGAEAGIELSKKTLINQHHNNIAKHRYRHWYRQK